MNDKNKIIMTVFIVTLMVGGALVPFTHMPSEEVDGKSVSEEQTMTLMDLIDAMKNTNSDLTYDDVGFTIVPVIDAESSDADPTPVDESIKETKTLSGGDYIIAGGSTITFGDGASASNNGKLIVDSDAHLIVCPLEKTGTDLGFTLVDNNMSGGADENVIVLKSGATVTICGITFKMFCGGDAEIPMIGLIKGTTAVFHSTYDTQNKYTFGFEVEGSYAKLILFGILDSYNGTECSITGTYDVGVSEGNDPSISVSYTDCIIDVYMNDGRFTYIIDCGKESTTRSSFDAVITPSASEDANMDYEITLGVNLKFDSFEFYKTGQGQRYTTYEFELAFSGMELSIANNIGTGEVTKTTELGWEELSTKKITATAKSFDLLREIGALNIDLKIENPDLVIDNPTMTKTEVLTSESDAPVSEITSMSSNMNVNLTGSAVSLSIPLILFEIKFSKVDNLALSIESLSTAYDADNERFATTTGTFTIMGTVIPVIGASNYNLAVSETITDFLLISKEESSALSFSADGDVSVDYNGSDKHLTSSIDTLSTNGEITTVSSIEIRNDIPLSKVIGVEQDMIGYFVMNDLNITVEDEVITIAGEDFDAECNTIMDGICDKVRIYTDSTFTLKAEFPETEPNAMFTISGTSFDGYLKNVGDDEEAFSITGSPATFKLIPSYPSSTAKFSNQVEIVSGTATFGAGLLPATLIVDSGVTFSADGLSANFFEFKNANNITGTVVIDLADKLIYPARTITIGSETVQMYIIKDKGGYALTVDLDTLECDITAHDGWSLKDNSVYTKDSDTHATFDFCNATFNGITSSEFYFSYEGESAVKVNAGDTIRLKDVPAKTGMQTVGWNDGNKTYAAGTDYIMPARTIVMKAVYAEIVTPTEVSSGVVEIKATASDAIAVAVNTDDLVGVEKATFIVNDTTVTLDKATIEALPATAHTVTITAQMVDDVYDETQKKIVGDNYLFDVGLFVDGERFTDFSEGMLFKVTLNVETEYIVESFNVSYMDDNGHLSEMTVDGYTERSNGTYDVTFTTSHFSGFVVEPVYSDVPEKKDKSTDFVLIFAIIVVVVALFCFVTVMYSDNKKN